MFLILWWFLWFGIIIWISGVLFLLVEELSSIVCLCSSFLLYFVSFIPLSFDTLLLQPFSFQFILLGLVFGYYFPFSAAATFIVYFIGPAVAVSSLILISWSVIVIPVLVWFRLAFVSYMDRIFTGLNVISAVYYMHFCYQIKKRYINN